MKCISWEVMPKDLVIPPALYERVEHILLVAIVKRKAPLCSVCSLSLQDHVVVLSWAGPSPSRIRSAPISPTHRPTTHHACNVVAFPLAFTGGGDGWVGACVPVANGMRPKERLMSQIRGLVTDTETLQGDKRVERKILELCT